MGYRRKLAEFRKRVAVWWYGEVRAETFDGGIILGLPYGASDRLRAFWKSASKHPLVVALIVAIAGAAVTLIFS